MQDKSSRNGLEIAIIGMSGRFPGAGNIREFWENLENGVNSIRFFTEEELLENNNLDPDDIKQPNYIKAKGIIDNVEYFDASFFGYSPAEAEL
jgi:acyl transferase domain-containing protein